jgi:hypothetical protein
VSGFFIFTAICKGNDMAFNLADYQTVQERTEIFHRLYPSGRIVLKLIKFDEHNVIMKCSVWRDGGEDRFGGLPDAVDDAQEPITATGINATSAVENCATSATGRALSLLGGELSPSKKRASASEMSKRGRVLLSQAQVAFDKGDLDELRELYTDSKESSVDPVIIQQILTLGSQLSQKKNSPVGKETNTTEEQPNGSATATETV